MDGDDYFCYLDGQKFSSRAELLSHIATDHKDDKEELAEWGISYSVAIF